MTQPSDYTLYENLDALLTEIQPDSITSRTFYKDDLLRAILFGFDAGQELSEHTSTMTAIIQVLRGEARVTLGADAHVLGAGAWVRMAPGLKHSIYANTPLVILLTMVEG